MCEILKIEGRAKEQFTKEALDMARVNNSDGAGFLILDQIKKNRWEVSDFQTFGARAEDYYGYYQPIKTIYPPKKTKKEKEANEIIFGKMTKLKNKQLMLIHYRLATSGMDESNTQPILKGNYIVIHNGIFDKYGTIKSKLSDSAIFTKKINNLSKKIKNIEKEEKEMIEKELKKAGGYYSIFIYSFLTKKLYYFKSEFASFYLFRGLGSTKKNRFPLMGVKAPNFKLI